MRLESEPILNDIMLKIATKYYANSAFIDGSTREDLTTLRLNGPQPPQVGHEKYIQPLADRLPNEV